MDAYATKKDVQEIVDRAVTDLSEVIASFAQQVDSRFNQVEIKAIGLETRLERLEGNIAKHDKQFDRLFETIDGFVGRIDNYETEQLVRDGRLDRTLEWARRVSEKTGIPLKNL